jgi:zinc/manganese transport system ATP-binding protein
VSDALLETRSACFGYSGRAVVEDATLEIQAGDFVALVGPNGSGKTTLLRGLLGFVPLLGGRVERRPGLRVGYVPQREGLDPLYPLSALDVTLLGTYGDTRPWRRSGAGERARAEAALTVCHASQLARRRYADLSGGQRQRVLIARALAVQPDLLLLDEPTAGVDSETSESIVATLDDLRRAHRLAIWMVSHDLEPLRLRVDRLARVDRGRLHIEGALR